MHSRSETIRRAMAGMEPEGEQDGSVTFSGAVSQVNIIEHATIHIESLNITAHGEAEDTAECRCPHARQCQCRKSKVTRLRPSPERP